MAILSWETCLMENVARRWGVLPEEMRQYKQWVVADANKAPHGVKPDGSLFAVGVTEAWREHWLTFEQAAQVAYANQCSIGFVLTGLDPFACIDMDVKDSSNEPNPAKHTTQQDWNRYWRIVQTFESYTERSKSGKGLHLWIKAQLDMGCRREGVEVYSKDRFMICTGDVLVHRAIEERQEWLNRLVQDMRANEAARQVVLEEVEETEDDTTIIERAISASNAQKFNDLCAGKWEEMNFASQSEADLALMSIFTFYSKSNEQCRRLFRMSALGKREKAVKDDRYLNYTLSVIRGRQARESKLVDASALQAQELARIQGSEGQAEEFEVSQAKAPQHMLHVTSGVAEPLQLPAPAAAVLSALAPVPAAVAHSDHREGEVSWPPGLAGQIAQFIYQSAPRPVKEVAIVGALGLLAGICGKAWYIPQSGLNMYIILIARSAIGKEAMHSGISSLISSVTARQPVASNFVDFNDFASGPALVKAVAANPCFVNVAGEWGRKLKQLAQEDGRQGPLSGLRTVMTNLYQKSGPQAIVGGITYSNKDSNIASVSGVSYSMIGESTPNTFYDSLTEGMMEDGFLSRFLIVEYDGKRPPLNPNPILEPSHVLSDAICNLCTQATAIISRASACPVGRTNEVAEMMAAFERECDEQINSTTEESWRQMWNRASLKVMRLSALLAVADNCFSPCIHPHHYAWAMDVVRKDIGIMSRRIDSGDVGNSDAARERKVLSLAYEYLRYGAPESYRSSAELRDQGIITRKYLQQRTSSLTTFNTHKLGATGALDSTVRSLIDSGYFMEVDKNKAMEAFGFQGKCYRIVSLPDYIGEGSKRKRSL